MNGEKRSFQHYGVYSPSIVYDTISIDKFADILLWTFLSKLSGMQEPHIQRVLGRRSRDERYYVNSVSEVTQ